MAAHRTFEGFIAEALKRCKDKGLTDDEITAKLGKSMTSIHRWKSHKPSKTGITTQNLKNLTELAGYDLGDCLLFPDEVGKYRALEVAIFGKDKEKPSG